MTEKAKKYLVDIQLAIQLIENFSIGINGFSDYQHDLKTKSAIERQLGIVGEAVNHYRREDGVSPLSNTRQIVDFRNRLIHSYDNIEDTIVWAILKNYLPTLKLEVEEALAQE